MQEPKIVFPFELFYKGKITQVKGRSHDPSDCQK